MAILSIIFISFMSMFPQMGKMNKLNEDKTQAINYTKEILIDWQNSLDVKAFLDDPTAEGLSVSPNKEDTNFYYFLTTKGNFDVKI
ncbi:hypothetical protein V7111_27285, partial [Neobacillus niacini]|uniref:hypothetical protein n=1 Tax=Neobacillus niacini TaxID=86668 RepID=UPI0030010F4C